MRLTILLLTLTAALSAADRYVVVPETSTVAFNGSSTLHDFAGTAKITSGAVTLDGASSAGAIEVDATTMNTAHESRDKKMHGEIMATKTYPTVRFDITGFTPSPEGGTVTGLWTMHGVSRVVSATVKLEPGDVVRAKSSFVLDIRSWDIPVPRAALVISVDPKITVTLDLALRPAPDAAMPATPPRTLAGLAITDAAGAPVQLDQLARNRPVIVFDEDGVSEAKDWVTALAAKLPADRQPIAVLTASGLSDKAKAKALRKGPAGALVDAGGALRTGLKLPTREALALTVTAEGVVGDPVIGDAESEGRDLVLQRLGVASP